MAIFIKSSDKQPWGCRVRAGGIIELGYAYRVWLSTRRLYISSPKPPQGDQISQHHIHTQDVQHATITVTHTHTSAPPLYASPSFAALLITPPLLANRCTPHSAPSKCAVPISSINSHLFQLSNPQSDDVAYTYAQILQPTALAQSRVFFRVRYSERERVLAAAHESESADS